MANPYTQNNPYLTNVADGMGQQPQYQGQMQDTSMQDMFHNQALNQMQQLAGQNTSSGGTSPMALAMALRNMGNKEADKSNLAEGWKDGLWQGNNTNYVQGTSLNAPQLMGESTAPANWYGNMFGGGQ